MNPQTVRYARTHGSMVILAVALTGGCTVTNPDYAGWASFEPRSAVVFEGYHAVNGTRSPLEVTEELLDGDRKAVHLRRTYTWLSHPKNRPARVDVVTEPARIHPNDHPLTHPQAVCYELGPEQVALDGETLECRVVAIELTTAVDGWQQKMDARLYLCKRVPGGLAKVFLRSQTPDQQFEMSSTVVGYHGVRDGREVHAGREVAP